MGNTISINLDIILSLYVLMLCPKDKLIGMNKLKKAVDDKYFIKFLLFIG